MICPKCGAQIEDGLTFCTSCGESVSVQPGAAHHIAGEQKSKIVAVLLAFFLGGLGIHNFYLGYTKRGILNIILSFLWGIGVIMAFVEGIMILTNKIQVDANGVYLK